MKYFVDNNAPGAVYQVAEENVSAFNAWLNENGHFSSEIDSERASELVMTDVYDWGCLWEAVSWEPVDGFLPGKKTKIERSFVFLESNKESGIFPCFDMFGYFWQIVCEAETNRMFPHEDGIFFSRDECSADDSYRITPATEAEALVFFDLGS